MASQTLVLDVQLDVLNQTITYKDYIRVIPESYWTDTLVPYMYPLWDTDKDKLIMFSWYTNDTYFAKRRKYVRDFKANKDVWKDYEMEAVAEAKATEFKDKLVEAFYLFDSLEDNDFQQELNQMYAKTQTVSRTTIRLARDFLLSETDWSMVSDAAITADQKALYTEYRKQLRNLTLQEEFSTNVQGVKFPISPEFYEKIHKVNNPSDAYLQTPGQFLPIAQHYLKNFRDKMAQYLLLKSWTEKAFFSQLLTEYSAANFLDTKDRGDWTAGFTSTAEEIQSRTDFLTNIITQAQAEIDKGG
tara:strand:+ start:10813 stop:11715 length:903 start_codon:yes stop_codon:yes gene_type:complete